MNIKEASTIACEGALFLLGQPGYTHTCPIIVDSVHDIEKSIKHGLDGEECGDEIFCKISKDMKRRFT